MTAIVVSAVAPVVLMVDRVVSGSNARPTGRAFFFSREQLDRLAFLPKPFAQFSAIDRRRILRDIDPALLLLSADERCRVLNNGLAVVNDPWPGLIAQRPNGEIVMVSARSPHALRLNTLFLDGKALRCESVKWSLEQWRSMAVDPGVHFTLPFTREIVEV